MCAVAGSAGLFRFVAKPSKARLIVADTRSWDVTTRSLLDPLNLLTCATESQTCIELDDTTSCSKNHSKTAPNIGAQRGNLAMESWLTRPTRPTLALDGYNDCWPSIVVFGPHHFWALHMPTDAQRGDARSPQTMPNRKSQIGNPK